MVPPMKQPDPQLPPLHTSPVPQLMPFVRLLHVVVLAPDRQIWHALLGFRAPGSANAPEMKQPASHAPALQKSPPGQPVPVATGLHPVVLVPG